MLPHAIGEPIPGRRRLADELGNDARAASVQRDDRRITMCREGCAHMCSDGVRARRVAGLTPWPPRLAAGVSRVPLAPASFTYTVPRRLPEGWVDRLIGLILQDLIAPQGDGWGTPGDVCSARALRA